MEGWYMPYACQTMYVFTNDDAFLYVFCTQAKHDTVPITAFEDMLNQDELYYPFAPVPISMHLMRGLVGVKPLWSYEWHICSGCHRHAYPPMHPKDYALPLRDDEAQEKPEYQPDLYRCPCCHKPRLHRVRFKNKTEQLQPYLVRLIMQSVFATLHHHAHVL